MIPQFLGLISTTASIFSIQTGVSVRNIIITVFCLLIGLLIIFARVFKSQLKDYLLSKGWYHETVWKRTTLVNSSDVERDVELDLI